MFSCEEYVEEIFESEAEITDIDLLAQLASEVMSGERLTQMTKTYNDVEAVTKLLEEKERDLELAARIGKSLLERNQQLEAQNLELLEQNQQFSDKLSQLTHNVAMKDALLKTYIQDFEEEIEAMACKDQKDTQSNGLALSSKNPAVDLMEKKIKELENENNVLKSSSEMMQTEVELLEEKEHTLEVRCMQELEDLYDRLHALQDELQLKTSVVMEQEEELTLHLQHIASIEDNSNKLAKENLELQHHLVTAEQSQKHLQHEVEDWETKYAECCNLLLEAQQQLRIQQEQQQPTVVHQHFATVNPFIPEGSLAQELEDTIRRDLQMPGRETSVQRKKRCDRVLETARYVRKTLERHEADVSLLSTSSDLLSSGSQMHHSASNRLDADAYSDEGYAMTDSMTSSVHLLGKAGIPGSNDFEMAIRRLASYRSVEAHNDSSYDHHESGKQFRQVSPPDSGCRTPDSLLTTGSWSSEVCNLSTANSSFCSSFRMPARLQIIKPMDGSVTLSHWQRLATPHFGGVLERRPGIQVKGENVKEDDEEIYTMNAIEEDDAHVVSSCTSSSLQTPLYSFAAARYLCENPNNMQLLPRNNSLSVVCAEPSSSMSFLSRAISLFSSDFWKSSDRSSSNATINSSDQQDALCSGTCNSANTSHLSNDFSLVQSSFDVTVNSDKECSEGVFEQSDPLSAMYHNNSNSVAGLAILSDKDEVLTKTGLMNRESIEVSEQNKTLNDIDVGLNTVMFMKRFIRWCHHNAVIHRSKAIDSLASSRGTEVSSSLGGPVTSSFSSPTMSAISSPEPHNGIIRRNSAELTTDDALTNTLEKLDSMLTDSTTSNQGKTTWNTLNKQSPPQRPTSLKLKSSLTLALSTDNTT